MPSPVPRSFGKDGGNLKGESQFQSFSVTQKSYAKNLGQARIADLRNVELTEVGSSVSLILLSSSNHTLCANLDAFSYRKGPLK
jgi:hypothetical protein